jgi:glycosyltransferase involved in cell wall biosynthesis
MQTYPISEIIIIDDASEDNSVQVIQKKIKSVDHEKIRLIINNKNSGNVFLQWKKAFELASGDFVWIAEADDSCHPRFLENLMPFFDDDEVIIAHCETLTMDTRNRILMEDLREWVDIFKCGKWDNSYIADGIKEICSTLCINCTIANVSGAVIKNENYDDILDVSSTFRLAGDWYFYMKLLEKGKLAYHKDSLNYHRMHEKAVTLTMNKEKEFQEICRVQDEALNNHNISDEVKIKMFERRDEVKKRYGI